MPICRLLEFQAAMISLHHELVYRRIEFDEQELDFCHQRTVGCDGCWIHKRGNCRRSLLRRMPIGLQLLPSKLARTLLQLPDVAVYVGPIGQRRHGWFTARLWLPAATCLRQHALSGAAVYDTQPVSRKMPAMWRASSNSTPHAKCCVHHRNADDLHDNRGAGEVFSDEIPDRSSKVSNRITAVSNGNPTIRPAELGKLKHRTQVRGGIPLLSGPKMRQAQGNSGAVI
jgi:hypothetical protein